MFRQFGTHLGTHLVHTWVHTFLREVHTLHTLWVFNPLINKNTNYLKYVYTRTMKSVYQQKETMYQTVYQLCTKLGGIYLNGSGSGNF